VSIVNLPSGSDYGGINQRRLFFWGDKIRLFLS